MGESKEELKSLLMKVKEESEKVVSKPNTQKTKIMASGPIISWHRVKGFGIVNKAEVDDFLELSCFFYDSKDVGNLIPGSFAFSKSSLNIWKFTIHVLLKPDLENFENYFTNVWNECNCAVV